MFNPGRYLKPAVVAALILCGSLTFAQGARTLVTELRDGDNPTALVSVRIPDEHLAALLQSVKPDPVTLINQGKNSDARIVPIAEIRMFLSTDPKLQTLKEYGGFSKYVPGLLLTIRLPAADQTVWFRDPNAKSVWYPVQDLGKAHGFKLMVQGEDTNRHTITILVTEWPLGDPMIGFGPRPS
jgi:hypothetical protein